MLYETVVILHCVLQHAAHTATHCNALQYTFVTLHCVPQHAAHTATHCNALQYTFVILHCVPAAKGGVPLMSRTTPMLHILDVLHCNTLHHTASHCKTLCTGCKGGCATQEYV